MPDGNSLVDELRGVWDRVPMPRDSWHPWAETIAQLDRDVRAALRVLAEDAGARGALVQVPAEEDTAATREQGALGEALRRLRTLPRPDGKHPYLADVLPGLEVAEAVLTALALSPASAGRFAEAQRIPASTATGS